MKETLPALFQRMLGSVREIARNRPRMPEKCHSQINSRFRWNVFLCGISLFFVVILPAFSQSSSFSFLNSSFLRRFDVIFPISCFLYDIWVDDLFFKLFNNIMGAITRLCFNYDRHSYSPPLQICSGFNYKYLITNTRSVLYPRVPSLAIAIQPYIINFENF